MHKLQIYKKKNTTTKQTTTTMKTNWNIKKRVLEGAERLKDER